MCVIINIQLYYSTKFSISTEFLRKKVIKIKICGIICEYNPLHKGHIYQIQEANRLIDADYIVCIMSGNFVQRGENAIFDKFRRCEAVLNSGADAVIELPQIYALQSAEYFAFGGVQIANSIGCTHLCFGSEAGNLDVLFNSRDSQNFKELLKSGLSYGKSLSLFDGEPNNLLGKEYLKSIIALNSNLIPITVKRVQEYASASKIRTDLMNNTTNSEMYSFSGSPLFFERFFELIKYRLISLSLEELSNICGVNEGLEYKIKKEIFDSNSIDELILNIKSKRYTFSRISRILCCALLDITKDKLQLLINDAPKAKLLGIKKESMQLLSHLNNYYISPLDSVKYNKSTQISSHINVLSTQIYSILSDLNGNEDYTNGLLKV